MKINSLTVAMLCTAFTSVSYASEAPDLGRSPTTESVNYVLNTYQADPSLPHITSYVSNWGQYGRKFNIGKVANGYDRIILSFYGMCGTKVGDPTITSAVDSLKEICSLAGAKDFEVISTDLWGDLATTAGGALTQQDLADAGNPNWDSLQKLAQRWYKGEDYAAGVMGYARKAKAENPNLHIGFSVGGWSLSEPFSRMAKDAASRKVFVDSIVNIFKLYPFFDQVDIDWEYPGGGGAEGNSVDDQDGTNYAMLIKELRTALNQANLDDVNIAIAAGAPKTKLDASNLKQLVDNGVNIIHLMTYDFFGTGWAEKIAHHTNLMHYDQDGFSADDSIKYMTDVLGIDPKVIYLGYAGYTRNGAGANITSYSPLAGTYNKSASNVAGSWENGTSEWYDITTNMVKVTPESGMTFDNPDYKLYTDAVANADFVYNANNHLFMSLDTPRTVFAKAQYAKEHGLGGVFNWMGDYADGLLLNAAREGLGQKVIDQKIDMHNIIYQCGENITSQEECIKLTNQYGDQSVTKANAGQDVTAALEFNTDYKLSGDQSTSEFGNLTYHWSLGQVVGIAKSDVELTHVHKSDAQFTLAEPSGDKAKSAKLTFNLTVTDEKGNQSTDSVSYTLQGENAKPVAIAKVTDNSVVGKPFNLVGSQSYDDDGDSVTCQWSQTKGEHVSLAQADSCDVSNISTANLSNQEQQLAFELTVSDGVDQSTASVDVALQANAIDNQPPVPVISVLGDSVVGGTVKLDGNKSTDDGVVASYHWAVTFNGSALSVDNLDQAVASFTPEKEGTYTATLTVTDNLGVSANKSQKIEVKAAPQNTWSADTVYNSGDHVIYNGDEYVAQWWTKGQAPGTDQVWKILSDGTVKDWSASTVYDKGDQAIYQGVTYTAKWWTQGNVPGTEQYGPWQENS